MAAKIRDRKLWDCESSLYDSFELKSFKEQLDKAINSRCLSMPRLSDPYLHTEAAAPKKRSRVLRSVRKLIRSVFGLKGTFSSSRKKKNMVECDIYGGYLSCDGFTTIPEGCESPEFDLRVVRKTFSERYTTSTGGPSGLAE